MTSRNPLKPARRRARPRTLSQKLRMEPDAVKEVKRNILLGSTMKDIGNEDVLACFKNACDVWLPQLGAADLAAAISYFNEVVGRHMAPRRAFEDGRERMH